MIWLSLGKLLAIELGKLLLLLLFGDCFPCYHFTTITLTLAVVVDLWKGFLVKSCWQANRRGWRPLILTQNCTLLTTCHKFKQTLRMQKFVTNSNTKISGVANPCHKYKYVSPACPPAVSQLYASPEMWVVYTNTKIAWEKKQKYKNTIRQNSIKI